MIIKYYYNNEIVVKKFIEIKIILHYLVKFIYNSIFICKEFN